MTDTPTANRDFFISFNQADRDWATWIAWVLDKNAYSVYFQDWDFRGSFIDQMHQASLQTGRTLVVLSDNYLRSEYALSEAWTALAGDPVGRKDLIVTIKVGPTGNLGLLGHFGYLDLTTVAEAEAERLLLERAKKALDPTYRAKPATRPQFPGQTATKPPYPLPAAGPTLATNNLPPFNPEFVGREGVLAELRRLLTMGQGTAVLTQAIVGLGGIGKTQTARAYACRHLADYDLVWWPNAETATTLAADYGTLAGPLGLDPGTADQAALVAAIRQRLQGTANWLLVFDNSEDPTLLRAWLPTTGGGHALITSRRTDWHGLAVAINLAVPPESEALELLIGRPDWQALQAAEIRAAKDLAFELGYLPLALAQVRAYVRATGKTIATYLLLFRASGVASSGMVQASVDYPASYATTWLLSIKAAAKACIGAQPLLELLAFFAPEPLPMETLGSNLDALPTCLRTEGERDIAIAMLRRYSLVDAENGVVMIHRLVQAVTRDNLSLKAAELRAAIAAQLVDSAIPSEPWDHRAWPKMAQLVPHALVTATWAQQTAMGAKCAGRIFTDLGLYFAARNEWAEAERAYKITMSIAEKTLPAEDPIHATQSHNLAGLYLRWGRYAEAVPLFRHSIALEIKRQTRDNAKLFARMSNLAALYSRLEQFGDAEALIRRVIRLKRRLYGYGVSHREIASSLYEFAVILINTGGYFLPEHLLQIAIEMDRIHYPPPHPEIGISLLALGRLYLSFRKFTLAEPVLIKALFVYKFAFPGRNNLEYARTMSTLGLLYWHIGLPKRSKILLNYALAIMSQRLACDNIDLANLRAECASLGIDLPNPVQSKHL
jgi:tetratricopeptide (TPR) repeat protein